ncbi:hypothetical protein LZ32DRAFT_126799 [Colletotrichum eremochloae]|nr:hypothetical protein LZ32DRAFT_126799 [Colletotrichum eremochloae]
MICCPGTRQALFRIPRCTPSQRTGPVPSPGPIIPLSRRRYSQALSERQVTIPCSCYSVSPSLSLFYSECMFVGPCYISSCVSHSLPPGLIYLLVPTTTPSSSPLSTSNLAVRIPHATSTLSTTQDERTLDQPLLDYLPSQHHTTPPWPSFVWSPGLA